MQSTPGYTDFGSCRNSQLLPITLGVVLVLWLQPYGAPSERLHGCMCPRGVWQL